MARRTLHLDLDLSVSDDAEPLDVAEAVLDYLADAMPGEVPGVFSFDGCEPRG